MPCRLTVPRDQQMRRARRMRRAPRRCGGCRFGRQHAPTEPGHTRRSRPASSQSAKWQADQIRSPHVVIVAQELDLSRSPRHKARLSAFEMLRIRGGSRLRLTSELSSYRCAVRLRDHVLRPSLLAVTSSRMQLRTHASACRQRPVGDCCSRRVSLVPKTVMDFLARVSATYRSLVRAC